MFLEDIARVERTALPGGNGKIAVSSFARLDKHSGPPVPIWRPMTVFLGGPKAVNWGMRIPGWLVGILSLGINARTFTSHLADI